MSWLISGLGIVALAVGLPIAIKDFIGVIRND
ncbi:hypothetical protein YTCETSXE_CDS0060 [Staphylococcus phage MVC_VPHSA2]|uniref:Uncharacterized protein n=1 Tax=Staphylococcus phage MVC_VPHSA1 TaxID=3088876 RepID=A0ABZ0QYW0_9CAUD|nr:hypothetical protein FBHYGVHD_CDS0075 [Staphylococcus phage MVC_VPHSA1]WPF65016.1 hypothetical protein YTCETSXE_CDS0060 [Staphylococcus phage MVC_VPHSA2]